MRARAWTRLSAPSRTGGAGCRTSAFCAGADVHELAHMDAARAVSERWLGLWEAAFRWVRKPVLEAVNGIAPGVELEPAMLCGVI
jgi:enoyl-CoA hydratase/carnithine racemase